MSVFILMGQRAHKRSRPSRGGSRKRSAVAGAARGAAAEQGPAGLLTCQNQPHLVHHYLGEALFAFAVIFAWAALAASKAFFAAFDAVRDLSSLFLAMAASFVACFSCALDSLAFFSAASFLAVAAFAATLSAAFFSSSASFLSTAPPFSSAFVFLAEALSSLAVASFFLAAETCCLAALAALATALLFSALTLSSLDLALATPFTASASWALMALAFVSAACLSAAAAFAATPLAAFFSSSASFLSAVASAFLAFACATAVMALATVPDLPPPRAFFAARVLATLSLSALSFFFHFISCAFARASASAPCFLTANTLALAFFVTFTRFSSAA